MIFQNPVFSGFRNFFKKQNFYYKPHNKLCFNTVTEFSFMSPDIYFITLFGFHRKKN